MKSLFKYLSLFFILLLSSHADESALEKITLQLSWKNQFQFAGYYMAKEKGYYSDVNLDVQIKELEGKEPLWEVENSQATYGVGHSSLIVDIANGAKVKMLATLFQSSPFVFIALKDSNITTVKDFVDKRVMITNDMASGITLKGMLNKNNMFLKDIKMQEHSYSVESLINGETDIMASYISNEPYILKEKGKEVTIIDPKNEGFDFYSDILFTSTQEVLLHKERVANFTKASLKGWEYAFSHIDETITLILKKYNKQNKSKEALLYEAIALKKLVYQSKTTLGEIKPTKVQRIYDIYNVMGLIKRDIKIDKLYYLPLHELLTSEEKRYLEEKKVIQICVNPDWMPYEKIEDAKHIGIGADYLKLFEKRLETEMIIVPTSSWEESLEFVKDRKCDILPLAMKTPNRGKYLNFTQPYVDLSLVMATRLDTPFMDDFTLLNYEKIGIIHGYAFIEILQKKYPNMQIVEVENAEDGLSQVIGGNLFGYVGGLADIAYLLQKNFRGALKISGKFDNSWHLSVAVRNDDKLLLEIFNKAVASVTLNESKKIENRWISVSYGEAADYRFFWVAFGVLTFVLSIALILYARQKEINKIMFAQVARDYMTQLYNRRHFTNTAEHILELSRRNLTDIAIIMVDIDDFKDVNDTFGHKSGDDTIIAIAKVMQEQSRKSDMIARWGGEEFLILLPETDIQGAQIIAEKIRAGVENLNLKTASQQEFHVSISSGISKIFIETDVNIEAAIMRADKALYEAKKSGKNRVCVNVEELSI